MLNSEASTIRHGNYSNVDIWSINVPRDDTITLLLFVINNT